MGKQRGACSAPEEGLQTTRNGEALPAKLGAALPMPAVRPPAERLAPPRRIVLPCANLPTIEPADNTESGPASHLLRRRPLPLPRGRPQTASPGETRNTEHTPYPRLFHRPTAQRVKFKLRAASSRERFSRAATSRKVRCLETAAVAVDSGMVAASGGGWDCGLPWLAVALGGGNDGCGGRLCLRCRAGGEGWAAGIVEARGDAAPRHRPCTRPPCPCSTQQLTY